MNGKPHRDGWGRPRLRWASAVMLSLTAHAIPATLMFLPVEPLPVPEERAIAVMVVPEPEPRQTGAGDTATPPPDADGSDDAAGHARLDPVEDGTADAAGEPLAERFAPAPEEAEVPVPTRRPDPPKRPAAPAVPEPEDRNPGGMAGTPEAAPPTPMRLAGEQGEGTAAPEAAPGPMADTASVRSWQARLMAHLERRKRYPSAARGRREEGTAQVRFRVDRGGNVLIAELVRSSGFGALDDEAVSLVRRASPVPAPPPGMNGLVTVPIRFSVR